MTNGLWKEQWPSPPYGPKWYTPFVCNWYHSLYNPWYEQGERQSSFSQSIRLFEEICGTFPMLLLFVVFLVWHNTLFLTKRVCECSKFWGVFNFHFVTSTWLIFHFSFCWLSMSRTLWIGDVQENWTEDYLCALMRNASMVWDLFPLDCRGIGVSEADARQSDKWTPG